jgi:hypothetical protein
MAWLSTGAVWTCTREGDMRGLAEKTSRFLAVVWFCLAAAVAGALWLLTIPLPAVAAGVREGL